MKRDNRRWRSAQRNRSRYSGSNSYNPTSVAYDYTSESQYYEPKRKQNISKKKTLKKIKIKTVDEKTVHSWRVYFAVFVVFGFSIYLIASNAFMAEQRSRILQYNEELKQIQEDNTYLQTELTKNLNLEDIEKQAVLRLGMQKPEDYQIVYIDVPAQSYTIKHENIDSEQDDSPSLFDKVKKFFGGE